MSGNVSDSKRLVAIADANIDSSHINFRGYGLPQIAEMVEMK